MRAPSRGGFPTATLLVVGGGETDRSVLLAVRMLAPVYRAFAFLFPRQQNLFAFMVRKPVIPDDVHPWLPVEEGRFRFNEEWASRTTGELRNPEIGPTSPCH